MTNFKYAFYYNIYNIDLTHDQNTLIHLLLIEGMFTSFGPDVIHAGWTSFRKPFDAIAEIPTVWTNSSEIMAMLKLQYGHMAIDVSNWEIQ